MEMLKCEKCGKVIEGFNKNHVEHLMQQHMLKHEREEKKNANKEQAANNSRAKFEKTALGFSIKKEEVKDETI